MPDLLKAFCPVCGVLLASRVVSNAQRSAMADNANRQHQAWDLNTSVTCANGHSFEVVGRVEIRWSNDG
jgi:hypothetical protein